MSEATYESIRNLFFDALQETFNTFVENLGENGYTPEQIAEMIQNDDTFLTGQDGVSKVVEVDLTLPDWD